MYLEAVLDFVRTHGLENVLHFSENEMEKQVARVINEVLFCILWV